MRTRERKIIPRHRYTNRAPSAGHGGRSAEHLPRLGSGSGQNTALFIGLYSFYDKHSECTQEQHSEPQERASWFSGQTIPLQQTPRKCRANGFISHDMPTAFLIAKNQKAMGDPLFRFSLVCVDAGQPRSNMICIDRLHPGEILCRPDRHRSRSKAAQPFALPLHFLTLHSRFIYRSSLGVPCFIPLCSFSAQILAASSGFPRASLFVRPLFDSSRLPRGFLDTSSTVHALQIVTGLSCSDCILKLDPGQQQHTFAQK